MPAPVYFIAGRQRADLLTKGPRGDLWNRDTLKSAGLDVVYRDVIDTTSSTCSDIRGAGPGGRSGVICCAWSDQPPPLLGYHPQHQDWHQLSDQLWIGFDKLRPLQPRDLARRSQLEGHNVTLCDGESWLVPIYRRPIGGTPLPQDIYRDQAGELVTEVKLSYRDVWERSGPIADRYYSGDGRFAWDEILDYCVDALAWNYRFDHSLQRLLRVIDTVNWDQVVGMTLDRPLIDKYLAAERESRPLEPAAPERSGTAGSEAISPITVPHEPTSTSPPSSPTGESRE